MESGTLQRNALEECQGADLPHGVDRRLDYVKLPANAPVVKSTGFLGWLSLDAAGRSNLHRMSVRSLQLVPGGICDGVHLWSSNLDRIQDLIEEIKIPTTARGHLISAGAGEGESSTDNVQAFTA